MKVQVGRSRNSLRPFDKTHDVNTTADWGFMAPTLCDEIVGGSKISFQANTFARLSPLVAPTFGRAIVKHYGYFVPIRDVQMNFENLMSGTIYNGGNSSYIPTQVATCKLNVLAAQLLSQSDVTAYLWYSDRGEINRTPVANYDGVKAEYQSLMVSLGLLTPYTQLSSKVVSDVTPEGADYLIKTPTYIICVRYTRAMRHLRKVFMGLGYQININNPELVSILPLLAYYKGWFDLFAVKRENNWQNTNAYKLIQLVSFSNLLDVSNQYSFIKFCKDLEDCYYVENPNYFTAHLDSMNKMMTSSVGMNVTTGYNDGTHTYDVIIADKNSVPHINSGQLNNPVAIRMAQIMLKWVNRNTAIGQRIAQYFAAHGLGDVDANKDVDFIGACSFNCDFDDVMSTSDTMVKGTDTGSSLGEYAGQGSASGQSDRFTYHARSTGFFIVYTTVVPRCGFVQGLSGFLHHRTRFHFFNPEFEATFMQVTPKSDVFGSVDTNINNSQYIGGNFGVIPNYSEYKYRNNYCGGDISLRSTRSSMLPYVLDRWFTPSDIVVTGEDEDFWYVDVHEGLTPQVNDEMRFIGKSELYGNFDRIFQQYDQFDEGRANDPFILHNVFNYVVSQPMLPLKQSFDTDAEGDSMTIEKA